MNIIQNDIYKIKNLKGRWNGYGIAKYPTIKTEDYFEELVFLTDEESSFLYYRSFIGKIIFEKQYQLY
ncbi:MAG: heme-binding beta-barrel domain-containing protein [Ignavibacteriaceae bacterium]